MTPTLRPFQEKTVNTLRTNISKGVRSQLVCSPTGSGKTVIASAIIQGAVKKGSYILFLAHRRELINQSCAKLEDFGVLNYSVIMSGDKRYNPSAKVHVASIQTLMKREFPPADLIIIVECHRAASQSYLDVLANYPNAKVIGLSATPERLDGKGLDDIFDEMVEVITIGELIDDGYLVKPTLYTGKFDSSLLSGIKKRQGDYAEGELQEAMDTPKLVGDIIANWKKHANGKLTVAFACGVEHSKHIAQEFFNAGISAASIDGSMPIAQRQAIIADWRKGYIKVVVNCMILTEGFDFPELECCILAAPTKSIAKALQMIGRIMRTADTKLGAIVLDHAGIIEEHGAPHLNRVWSLLGEKARSKKDKKEALVTCDCCDLIFSPEPKAWLSDVQEKLLSDLKPKAASLMRVKKDGALALCPGCGIGNCKVCNSQIKLVMAKIDIDEVAFTKEGFCSQCHALYTDDQAHIIGEEEEKELPTSSADELTLYESDEMPLALKVKNKFRQHMRTAQEKGWKRGSVYHKIKEEFGEEGAALMPRHTGAWWKASA